MYVFPPIKKIAVFSSSYGAKANENEFVGEARTNSGAVLR
jgi:hypothetical protein